MFFDPGPSLYCPAASDIAPYLDSDLDGIADDPPNPEARYMSRQAVQLAFVAVIQLSWTSRRRAGAAARPQPAGNDGVGGAAALARGML